MGNVKKSIAERTRHERQYDRKVNKRQIQTKESKIDTGKALDASLVIMECSGTEFGKQDTSSRSGNDTYINDADIRPIYDEEPMAEMKLGKTQERDRNSKTSVLPSAKFQSTAIGSKLKPRSNNHATRSLPVSKSSCLTIMVVPIADHFKNSNSFSDSKHFVCSTCHKCVFNANHDACITKFLKEVNSRAKTQSNKTRNRNKPVEQKSHTQTPTRQIFKGHRFSPNKTFAVYEKTSPISDLRWKPTCRIFKTIGLRWVPTGKILASYTSISDSKSTHGSNVDIFKIHECKQTLDLSADHSKNSNSFSDSKHFVCSTCHKCVFNANHDACITKFLKEVNSRAKTQSNKTRNRNKPVEQKSHTQTPTRQIFKGHRFSPNKTFAVYEKTSPISDLRWKPTCRIFKTVGLMWVPTGKILASCTSISDSKSTHGSNVDIFKIHKCKQTLDLSAGTSINVQKEQIFDLNAGTSYNVKQDNLKVWLLKKLISQKPVLNWISKLISRMTFEQHGSSLDPQCQKMMFEQHELESLFGPLFDEYFNRENRVILKSSAVTTADASDKRQQQSDSTSSTLL
nr:hypothetical protein [Tanacetum cinerariifolium]